LRSALAPAAVVVPVHEGAGAMTGGIMAVRLPRSCVRSAIQKLDRH